MITEQLNKIKKIISFTATFSKYYKYEYPILNVNRDIDNSINKAKGKLDIVTVVSTSERIPVRNNIAARIVESLKEKDTKIFNYKKVDFFTQDGILYFDDFPIAFITYAHTEDDSKIYILCTNKAATNKVFLQLLPTMNQYINVVFCTDLNIINHKVEEF